MSARRKRSTVARARSAAHRTSVVLGHVRAVQTGRVPQRVVNVGVGRLLASVMRGKWL